MITLSNVTTTDNYKDATLGPVPTCQQIRYLVANKPVLCQIMPVGADLTERPWGAEVLITPESNVITRCQAIRFKSAVSGAVAQIIAQLIEPGDPVPTAGTPFAGTLSAGGGVTPGTSSVQVQIDGSLVATEPILDFVTGIGIKLSGSDDVAGTRTLLTIAQVAIAETILGAPAGSIDVQNIPQTYRHLYVLSATRNSSAGDLDLTVIANNDAANNYPWQVIRGAGATASAVGGTTGATILGNTVGTGGAANIFGGGWAVILNYRSSAMFKTYAAVRVAQAVAELLTGRWSNVAAINRLTASAGAGSANLDTGSEFSIIGAPTT